MEGNIQIIQTTLPNNWIEPQVGEFCQYLLEAGAACIQYNSVSSMYHWQGEIISEGEWRLEIKSSIENNSSVITALKKQHPYDTPQILIRNSQTSIEYAKWVNTI